MPPVLSVRRDLWTRHSLAGALRLMGTAPVPRIPPRKRSECHTCGTSAEIAVVLFRLSSKQRVLSLLVRLSFWRAGEREFCQGTTPD